MSYGDRCGIQFVPIYLALTHSGFLPALCIKTIAISALQLPALHSVDNVITVGTLLEAVLTYLHTKMFCRRAIYNVLMRNWVYV